MATCYDSLSIADCNKLLSVCEGLKVSHVWRSIAPCVSIEIGRLSKDHHSKNPQGRITIMIEADWRIEKPRSIQVGSGFSTARIERRLATIIGVTVNSLEIIGSVPEIAITLSDRRRFSSFTNWDAQPRWSIGFRDCGLFPLDPNWHGIDVSPWIYVRSGRAVIEYCYDDSNASTRKIVRQMGLT